MAVSLVMATFNGEKYLREQLNSIVNQTLVPDEIIVVDDCSTDNTLSVLSEFKGKCNLKIYTNDTNKGVNTNFERAISLASGDYICISDQDDVWFPEKIEKTYKKLKEIENDSPACVSSEIIDVDSNLQTLKTKCTKDSFYESALYSNGSQGCTLMFNKKLKDIMLPIPKEFIYDHFIGLLSCFVGTKYGIGEPLMYYRHHGNNVVSGRIHKYHKGLSEAIAIYYLLKRKERLYLLEYLRVVRKIKMSEEKKSIFEKAYDFYNVDSHFQMILNVWKNSYYTVLEKFYFITFVSSLVFLKKRRVETMKRPF